MTHRILHWEDVAVGSEIPPVSLELTHNRIVTAVCATRDIFPLHHDPEFAIASGYKAPVIAGAFLQGFLERCITDWTGPRGKLRKLSLPLRTPNYKGDNLTAQGKVIKKYVENGDHRVDCELVIMNQDGVVTVNAQATVTLPSKA